MINLKELRLGLSKQYRDSHSLTVTVLRDLLNNFDANNNGVSEKDEFINLMHATELDDFFADNNVETNKGNRSALNLEVVYKLTPTPEEIPTLIEEKIAEFNKNPARINLKNKIG